MAIIKTHLEKFTAWRIKNIADREFMYILSVVVGIAAGLSAVIIKNSVHVIHLLADKTGKLTDLAYFHLVSPIIGITLAVLFIKFIIKSPVRHGIPNVLHSIGKKRGKIKAHNMYSSIVTSALTVGFGGSVGLEGPTVATGAAIGSNIGKALNLNYRQVTLLLGCACAGAMASIFKAPVAAIVFAIEVIMLDLTAASLIPLLLSSVSATIISYLFMGSDLLYPFKVVNIFTVSQTHWYILLGIVCGLVSVYFTRVYMYIGNLFDKIGKTRTKLAIGAISLGVLVFLFPSLYGDGYDDINLCLSNDITYLYKDSIFEFLSYHKLGIIALLIAVILLKVVATSITFGAGGVGGIFAPTLFMGVNTGMLFSTVLTNLGVKNIHADNIGLMAMGGLIAGVLHAPLTAVFLIADLSGGYQLFLPLMITATFSYSTARIFESHSVYTIQLARRKELITHHKDKAVLTLMNVNSLIETNFNTVDINASLADLVKVISKSKRNIFPVIDENNYLLGIVVLNDIRHIVFRPEVYKSVFVRDIMFMPPEIVHPDDAMEDVAKKFQKTDNYNIPVIKDGKYIGFVSRANVFSKYREMIQEISED